MSSSEDDSSPDTCSTCSRYAREGRLDFSKSAVAASAAVHQECSECDAFEIDESQLCGFCIHIRPSHLLTCRCVHDLYRTKVSSIEGEYNIVMGTLSELKSRQRGCAFCRWCVEAIQANARLFEYNVEEYETIRIERDIWIELRNLRKGATILGREAHAYVSVKAKTYRSYLDSDQRFHIGHNKGYWKTSVATENVKLADSSPHSFGDFSLASSIADWATVRQWKSVCEKDHGACGERAASELPAHFRLIDVTSRYIIDITTSPPSFFALSYVWGAGSEDEMTLRQNNLVDLQKPGSLHELPRTIVDAMRVCEQLGQRYLWVDRLCIVQDDKQDKYGQIRSLEAIYSRAELVIIAASGDDMQSGLPGVDNTFPRQQYQFATDVFGFTLVNKLHDFSSALRTVWNDRGWTYQEAVLARRKLYFTAAEIWFECAEGIKRQNEYSTTWPKARGYQARSYTNAGSSGDDFEDYRYHLGQYSRRILTYPSDVYHAFRGIEAAFYPGSEIIHGLPACDFSRALLWSPYNRPELQERQCSDQEIVLPSWSWASLIGAIETCGLFGTNKKYYMHGSFYCSLCKWETSENQDDQQALRQINSIHDEDVWKELDKIFARELGFDKRPNHRQVLALAWAKGCIEADVPNDLFQHDFDPRRLRSSSSISAKELALRWPTLQDFWTEVRKRNYCTEDPPGPPTLEKGHILTRTQSSTLRVEYEGKSAEDAYSTEKFLIRHAPTGAGSVEIIGSLLGAGEYKLRGTMPQGQVANVDFIALALGYMPGTITMKLDRETQRGNRFHQDQSSYLLFEDQPGVIVMAVTWTGSIARRLALGWVTLQGWVDSKPTFRRVVLA
ncbi:hypothetical protein PFICI_05684 [Pestalotiopsis fici W106-1]|uniref:Heterokaryon incompatibility domain-containing protein n=1 Tax=Pestalotiopsis fici (strain W106-1 / CGMCC3.15140) TaxID=1229662 RepID=W3XCJ0_PESFW|nr:uncharacterized protein PFICI_05684 [Pestalotiopsis fici W106-1]ETS83808.1 hypothetical protein PFICI_05684 [Pestalotiopsis fici W106-1]